MRGDHALPTLSVVVPTCNRPALLERCLRALEGQRLAPERYEILIVDDRPGQATRELVERHAALAAPGGLAIRYLPGCAPHGPAAARNCGWRAARAPLIAFTDDDTEPHPDWLANGFAALRAGADVVCGRIVMPTPSEPTDYERDARHLETAEFVTANCLCRRPMLERVGGFDEDFRLAWREDSDLQFRLLRAGARIARAEAAIVVHPVRPAPWGVSLSQQKKVMFDALLFKKHRRLYRERIRATPRWDYYAIVASLVVSLAGAAAGKPALSLTAFAVWLALTAHFCAQRLRGTSRRPAHVLEIVLTSALIPPLAVFWRFAGALRFRVAFV